MFKQSHIVVFIALTIILTFTHCSNFKDVVYINELTQNKVSENRLERITNHWVGHFSNKESLKNNSQVKSEQELIGRRIWKKNRVGEYWIYAGWFQAGSYEKALSSNVAQITRISPDTAFITFYKIKDGLEIKDYEWKKDDPFKTIKRSDLESRGEGCGSFIVEKENGNYQVFANQPCYSPMSAQIKYYKINATLTSNKIIMNSRFLDDQFNVVLQHDNHIYSRFNRSELEKKYKDFALID